MGNIPQKSTEALQRGLLLYGDAAFRMCYMHTKNPDATRTLLNEVFTRYLLRTKPFLSEADEKLWVMRIAHRACMEYYTEKLREKPTAAQIQAAGKDLEFLLSDALCSILNLPYTVLSALSLCCGDGETTAFAAKVTGRSEKSLKKLLRFAADRTGLSAETLRKEIGTVQFPEELHTRILNDITNRAEDPHFVLNGTIATLKRTVNRCLPYAALILLCMIIVFAVRSGWFG